MEILLKYMYVSVYVIVCECGHHEHKVSFQRSIGAIVSFHHIRIMDQRGFRVSSKKA